MVVGRSTIAAVLREHGLDPAPTRRTKPAWKQFLAAHWDVLAAADFFHVEVLTLTGIVRDKVFFVLRLATRRVEVAGIARDTDVTGPWLVQLGRNLTDASDGFLRVTSQPKLLTELFQPGIERLRSHCLRLSGLQHHGHRVQVIEQGRRLACPCGLVEPHDISGQVPEPILAKATHRPGSSIDRQRNLSQGSINWPPETVLRVATA